MAMLPVRDVTRDEQRPSSTTFTVRGNFGFGCATLAGTV
jgi:hypothetical protein